MDWEQYQPESTDIIEDARECHTPVATHLLTHAISFALGSATAAYYLRWNRSTQVQAEVLKRSNSDASSCLPHQRCDEPEVSPKENADMPLSSHAPMRTVPDECSLRSAATAEVVLEPDRSESACTSMTTSNTIGELEIALRDPTLAELLSRAEYSGARGASGPAQLLLQIALDAPARWSAADYEFVTHCKGLVSLADREHLQLHSAAMRIERLQGDIWRYFKLQLKRSEVGIQARDDRRKHAVACSSQLQVLFPPFRSTGCTTFFTMPSPGNHTRPMSVSRKLCL